MKIRIPLQESLLFTLVVLLCTLYINDFFVPEEKIYSNPTAYIEGATPSTMARWEMY